MFEALDQNDVGVEVIQKLGGRVELDPLAVANRLAIAREDDRISAGVSERRRVAAPLQVERMMRVLDRRDSLPLGQKMANQARN